jgi:hypothetical protein
MENFIFFFISVLTNGFKLPFILCFLMTDLYSILYIVWERLAIPEDRGCGGGVHSTASDHL